MSIGTIADLIEILQGVHEKYGNLSIYDCNGIASSLPDIVRAGRDNNGYHIVIGTIPSDSESEDDKKPTTRMMSSTSGRAHAGGGPSDDY